MTKALKKAMIGYIRVSTDAQAKEGIGLDTQSQALRNFAQQSNVTLHRIFEDAASGYGINSLQSRVGLNDAIREAQALGLHLLVPSISRLSRDISSLKMLEQAGIKVVSADDGRTYSKKALKLAVGRAQVEAEEIQKRTSEGIARAKARGVPLGNKTNLPAAQRKGSAANIDRADKKVQDLADFLQANPAAENMKRNDLVDFLNTSGPQNLVSDRSGVRKPWTLSALKKPLARAKEELIFRQSLQLDTLDFPHGVDAARLNLTPGGASHELDAVAEEAKETKEKTEEERSHEHYRNVPNYNRF